MSRHAVFLDRDGTIIEDIGYISDPRDVALLPGATEAIKVIQRAGFLAVLVSNQSGVARGYFDEAQLEAVHCRLVELLAENGVELDGAYYCPYLEGDEAVIVDYRRDSELRKPRPGMLIEASKELDIDLNRSWMIGDAPQDVEAGRSAGCRSIRLGEGDPHSGDESDMAAHVSRDLLEAVEWLEPRMKETEKRSQRHRHSQGGENVEELLQRISEQIDHARREKRQEDFSILRLFGALLQMLAIVAGVWGAVSLLNDQSQAATARLMFACFLQMASLSAVVTDRLR